MLKAHYLINTPVGNGVSQLLAFCGAPVDPSTGTVFPSDVDLRACAACAERAEAGKWRVKAERSRLDAQEALNRCAAYTRLAEQSERDARTLRAERGGDPLADCCAEALGAYERGEADQLAYSRHGTLRCGRCDRRLR